MLDSGLTNNIEEQEGSLCGLGFWRLACKPLSLAMVHPRAPSLTFSCEPVPSQYTRYQLCLVSRKFNELCTPLLYRDVKLPTGTAILLFARTLSFRPLFASYTLRLDVDLSPFLNNIDEKGYSLMREALGFESVPDGFEAEDDPIGVISELLGKLENLQLFLWVRSC